MQLLAKKYNYNEGLSIRPNFFNKFCLFHVNLSVQINYPKDNDEKINDYKMSSRMLIFEYPAIKLVG